LNEYIRKAELWLLRCIRGGLAHSYDTVRGAWVKPYPEVTGYLVSYFSAFHRELPPQVIAAARKLRSIQDSTGGYPTFTFDDRLFTFDTAQIAHGFLRLYEKTADESHIDAAKQCGEFLLQMQIANGAMYPVYQKRLKVKTASKETWGTGFSGIQVKNIESLLLLHKATGEERYKLSAERLCAWGKENCDLRQTHPAAYCYEGLLAMGAVDFVRNQLTEHFAGNIGDQGYIPYDRVLPYAYVSGSIQLGILLFKTGFVDEAKRIRHYGRQVQKNSPHGGLLQYADENARPVFHPHGEINSWGTKYFCELERLFLGDEAGE